MNEPSKTTMLQALDAVASVTNDIYKTLFVGDGTVVPPSRPSTGAVDAAIVELEIVADKLRVIWKEVQLLK